MKTDKRSRQATVSPPEHRKRPLWVIGLAAGAVLIVSMLLWAGYGPLAKGLPDLLGSQRALPLHALHVDDAMADLKGYQGTILVRGVMAVASPNDSTLIGLIDSREARICKNLHCAKQYLPVKTSGPVPKPWDEINVWGKVVSDPNMTYLQVVSIENLGSIKQ
ncbi:MULTISPECIES: hypothetical protein [Vibrio harveyi group]|nr:hypothetical protein [Vibrio campbellii]UMM06722.1 hypothetical protein MKR81_26030 [Vibrio campbellii]